jgi:broad specificity phosphatase PhoE
MIKPTTLYLIRHGQTEYNRMGLLQGRGIDAPLDQLGQEQSYAVARYLKQENIDCVYSSSLTRARNTAQIISEQLGLPLSGSFADLDEMHFGVAEGREFSAVNHELQELYDKWESGIVSAGFERGESPIQVLDRAHNCILSVLKEHEGQSVVFVIHGRLIRIILSHWLGIGLHRMNEIQHSNTSVNKLIWNGIRFRAVQLNQIDHLKELDKAVVAVS